MSAPIKLQWNYKDGNRDYWQITAWKSDITRDENDDVHWQWEYSITRSSVEFGHEAENIHRGFIIGQYDNQINLNDVLFDFAGYFSGVVIGFAANGEKI